MQPATELIPHLFRTEYRKIIAVLCKLFGIEHIELAEDIASETFLSAAETWGLKGLPANPVAWLYAVAKNSARDHFRRNAIFTGKIAKDIRHNSNPIQEIEVDLSDENINDSQLQMMFAVCHPSIPQEAQIGLALNILCGFGAEEIADAFLTNKETIYKRLARAKEKLKTAQIKIELPDSAAINNRLQTILSALYLLFNEGYYSRSQNEHLRKDLCLEAMRLNYLLVGNKNTDTSAANALLALMCFHASRFDARIDAEGQLILYEDQDTGLWNEELMQKGEYYLNMAAKGDDLSKYHIEAAIAWWHTQKEDTHEKWIGILKLYNQLLIIAYSPAAALNRTYALAKAHGKELAIKEAEKLGIGENYHYYSLLGFLYTGIDDAKTKQYLELSLSLARSAQEAEVIKKKLSALP